LTGVASKLCVVFALFRVTLLPSFSTWPCPWLRGVGPSK